MGRPNPPPSFSRVDPRRSPLPAERHGLFQVSSRAIMPEPPLPTRRSSSSSTLRFLYLRQTSLTRHWPVFLKLTGVKTRRNYVQDEVLFCCCRFVFFSSFPSWSPLGESYFVVVRGLAVCTFVSQAEKLPFSGREEFTPWKQK